NTLWTKEETLEKLEKTIEILKERLLAIENDQKETKVEVLHNKPEETVSSSNLKDGAKKSPELSDFEQSLKAQADEISCLKKMVEDLLSRPTAIVERPISTITPQQPVYVVSSKQNPISRQLFENESQETNDERLRELIESMNLAIEIDQAPATLLREANDTEEILNVQSLDIPKLREPDVELQLMIENFFLKMEVEQLANEMDSLRKEFLQLKTTVGEIKKSNIEEQKQAPVLARDREFTVFFANNSSSLSASDLEMVKTIARKVANNRTSNVILNGYSSTTGSADYNMQLSRRRADEVRKALIANGLLANRISIFYHGADPKTPEENARRVEILIIPSVETKVIDP
ncbi:MAG: OmpA family protein, partial [Candidatus Moranbacteria bacterium]|nr:OmpA family protein [Candidatus Moranbacteria bacterium]